MKGKVNRIIALTSVIMAAVFIGVIGAMLSTAGSTALATPGRTGDCTGCHDLRLGNLRIATNTTTKTVAPGEAFAIGVSFTGGGSSRTEINWPNVLNNTLFAPTPRVPFSTGASTGSASSTLTAPATPGTYTVRVFAAQSSPDMETDFKDMTITVSAAQTTFTITASAGANGSITPAGAVTVNSGAGQTFAIAAATGYHVANVLVDGTSVGAVTSYTFSNVTAAHTISATFAINTYTITASAGSNGSITPSGVVTVNSGAGQTFAIAASTGYHVANVLVDGTSVGAVTSYTFTNVTAAHTISATFAINTYTITSSAGANGSITPSGAVTVNSGAGQTFAIAPNTGYHVANVVVDGVSAGAVTSYTFSNVTAAHTISATFAADAVPTFILTASAGSNGSITPSGAVTVNSGSSQTFAIAASTGYHVANVLVDGTSAGAVTSYTFNNVTAAHTISATFAANPVTNTYTITASAGANGSISPSGIVTVSSGARKTFTFSANRGYRIARILVDGRSVSVRSSYTFRNVKSNHTISVTFAPNRWWDNDDDDDEHDD